MKILIAVLFFIFALSIPGETYMDWTVREIMPDDMVFVKKGCFEMGDVSSGKGDEKPLHEVCVDDFYMGKHEVTAGEFGKFVKEKGYKTDAGEKEGCLSYSGFYQDEDHPAVCVNWHEAAAYCDWKGEETGLDYRLPTEAEWEYVARGSGKEIKWSGTNNESELYKYANFCDVNCEFSWKDKDQDDVYKYTAPVKSYLPNSLGIYDMSGNAWEWVKDCYVGDIYKRFKKKGTVKNPAAPESSGCSRVVRGGSWFYDAYNIRASNRDFDRPGTRSRNVGFRCAQ